MAIFASTLEFCNKEHIMKPTFTSQLCNSAILSQNAKKLGADLLSCCVVYGDTDGHHYDHRCKALIQDSEDLLKQHLDNEFQRCTERWGKIDFTAKGATYGIRKSVLRCSNAKYSTIRIMAKLLEGARDIYRSLPSNEVTDQASAYLQLVDSGACHDVANLAVVGQYSTKAYHSLSKCYSSFYKLLIGNNQRMQEVAHYTRQYLSFCPGFAPDTSCLANLLDLLEPSARG
jgi:hypothetical protein